MKCNDIKTRVDDYLDRQLAAEDHKQVEVHLDVCENCNQYFVDARRVRDLLIDLPVDEPSEGFEQRMFSAVRRQYPQSGQHHFKAGFVTALAASLVIWFAASVFVTETVVPLEKEMVSIGLQETRDVRLVFTSAVNIQQVSLQIELPDNIEIQGYPGQKQLAWETRLDKGQNILTLPVQALGEVKGELVARVSYGDKQKTYRLLLKTVDGGALNGLHLNQQTIYRI